MNYFLVLLTSIFAIFNVYGVDSEEAHTFELQNSIWSPGSRYDKFLTGDKLIIYDAFINGIDMNRTMLVHKGGEKSGMILGNRFRMHDIVGNNEIYHYRVYDLVSEIQGNDIVDTDERIILEISKDGLIECIKLITYKTKEMFLGIPDNIAVFISPTPIKVSK